nr:hypothetical protein [Mucilaginibacter sp. X4EP1]
MGRFSKHARKGLNRHAFTFCIGGNALAYAARALRAPQGDTQYSILVRKNIFRTLEVTTPAKAGSKRFAAGNIRKTG